MEREHLPIITAFIKKLAKSCNTFGHMAGVGGAETAGHLISYFVEHPNDLEPFLVGGFMELPDDWMLRGCLTYHAQNGKLTEPQAARFSRIINKMKGPNP